MYFSSLKKPEIKDDIILKVPYSIFPVPGNILKNGFVSLEDVRNSKAVNDAKLWVVYMNTKVASYAADYDNERLMRRTDKEGFLTYSFDEGEVIFPPSRTFIRSRISVDDAKTIGSPGFSLIETIIFLSDRPVAIFGDFGNEEKHKFFDTREGYDRQDLADVLKRYLA